MSEDKNILAENAGDNNPDNEPFDKEESNKGKASGTDDFNTRDSYSHRSHSASHGDYSSHSHSGSRGDYYSHGHSSSRREHSSHSHSGSSDNYHRSSRSRSGSHGDYSSRSHSSSGRSSSSSRSRSGGSRSSSSSRSRSRSSRSRSGRSERDRVMFERRLRNARYDFKVFLKKNKPKYVWRRTVRYFKKASLQKKIAFIMLGLAFFTLLGFSIKIAVSQNPPYESGTVIIEKVTKPPIPYKEQAPEVKEGYVLNELHESKTFPGFFAGFKISLPVIDSEEDGIVWINEQINHLRDDIKKKYAASIVSGEDTKQYDYSYRAYSTDSVLFISLYKQEQNAGEEPVVTHSYYFYNYIEDVLVREYDLAKLFNISETHMIDIINSKLSAIGADPVESVEGLELFVNKEGKLTTQVIAKGSGITEKLIDVVLT